MHTNWGNEYRGPNKDGDIEIIYDAEYDDGLYLSKTDLLNMIKLLDETSESKTNDNSPNS